jgi:hypothetical protein
MTKSFCSLLVCAVALISNSCRRPAPVLSVDALLATAESHNRTVVTVRGCVTTGPESMVLQSCDVPDWPNRIWVDDIRSIEDLERAVPSMKKERATQGETLTGAEYESYKRLMGQQWPNPTPVTLQGEFQWSSDPKFGHLNGYKARLILYRVVSFS